ncbi:MAG: hypothetical protein H6732_18300 [Alphaproteobacteria bacterium]|nr:hypothetical protein [Alphaproteobacteria bacterium]
MDPAEVPARAGDRERHVRPGWIPGLDAFEDQADPGDEAFASAEVNLGARRVVVETVLLDGTILRATYRILGPP